MDEIKLIVREDFSLLPEAVAGEKELFLVYDANVQWAAMEIERLLEGPAFKGGMALCATEGTKVMDTVVGICQWLLEMEASRDALVLALGGGVTTDLAGFAASIFKRGVRFATLPTTLLSQVDAGIGGKTGVNLDGYKNIIGSFRQPEFVYISSSVLTTLPECEFRSGLAEMLKTFVIDDASAYRKMMEIVRKGDRMWWCGTENLTDLIRAAAAVKCGVVSRDEFETGERRVLNLGHTVGHAIEWWQNSPPEEETGTKFSHGEAVAIGMVAAARVSEALGLCRKGLAEQLRSDLKDAGLPTVCPVPTEALSGALRRDKKAASGLVQFVLIREIGEVEVRGLQVEDLVKLLS